MSKKTKQPSYTTAVVVVGVKNFTSESWYDSYKQSPRIIAVAKSWSEAQAWMERKDREQKMTPLLPGQGYHQIFGLVSLDREEAYACKQDVARLSIDVGIRKLQLLSRTDLVRI